MAGNQPVISVRDLAVSFGEIETQMHATLNVERRVALDRNAILAHVDDLVQIEHRALRFGSKTRVGGRLNLVSHTLATIWDRGS